MTLLLDPEMVLVATYPECLPETFALRERAARKRAGASENESPPSTVTGLSVLDRPSPDREARLRPHTRDEVRNLKAAMVDAGTVDGVLALFDLCCETGDWVAKREAEEASGLDKYKLRKQMQLFSAIHAKAVPHKEWPITWRRHRGHFFYRLHPAVIDWWREG